MTTITFLSKEEERRRKKKKGEREKEREEEEVVVFVVVVVFKLHPRRIFRNRLFTFSKMNTRRQKWTHRNIYLGTLLHIHIAFSIYLHSEEYLLLF